MRKNRNLLRKCLLVPVFILYGLSFFHLWMWVLSHQAHSPLPLFSTQMSDSLLRKELEAFLIQWGTQDTGWTLQGAGAWLTELGLEHVIGWFLYPFLFCIALGWPAILLGFAMGALWRSMIGKANTKHRDFLSVLGNGRIFYSGIKGALTEKDLNGYPHSQLLGLAVPKRHPMELIDSSPLKNILDRFGATNETNRELLSIIMAHEDWPVFVPEKENRELYQKKLVGFSLGQVAQDFTEEVLQVHADILNRSDQGLEYKQGDVLTPAHYRLALSRALLRVLHQDEREALSALPASQVGTLALSILAGVSLRYEKEGSSWVETCSAAELSTRAVLHSLSSFTHDYDVDSRTQLRRAIIYSSRYTTVALNRTPIDMTVPTHALRQWAEIFFASPLELQTTADEVELSGLIRSVHERWSKAFFERWMHHDPRLVNDAFSAPQQKLSFVSVAALVDLVRVAIQGKEIRRIEELIQAGHQKERIQSMSREIQRDGQSAKSTFQPMRRIEPPLSLTEIKSLSSLHGLPIEVLKDWSTLRIVLGSYGWLARRVGDSAVPGGSVVFCGLKEMSREGVEKKIEGRKGIVALRAARLTDHFGPPWADRTPLSSIVHIADSLEGYEKLLREEFDSISEDSFDMSSR